MAQQSQQPRKNNNQQSNNQNRQQQQQQQAQKQQQPRLSFIGSNAYASADQQRQFNDFVSEGSKAFEQAVSASTEEAKKIQERVLEFSRESAENMAKSADSAVKNFNEAVELSKENFEAVVESTNIASKISKAISTEVSEFANDTIAENFKAFEEFLGCKTASDFFNLQSAIIKNNLDSCFNESLKLSELFMQYAKAAEPVGERITITTEKLAKNATA